jgi:LemA protein
MKISKIWIIVIVVVALLAMYGFATYNRFVTLDETATAQWKQVEAQYQRRFDLVPNLVELAKGVMKQEQTVFSAIAEARTRYAGAQTGGSVDEKVRATAQLDSALS